MKPPMKLTPRPIKLMPWPMKPLIESMGLKPTKTMRQRAAKADKPKQKRPKAMVSPKAMVRLQAKLWPKRPFGFAVAVFTPSQHILQSLQK